MAGYPWLDKIQHQFHYIGDEGAFAELEFEQPKDSYVRCRSVNNDYFLLTPQVLRRCFFLSPNEKTVLWELMSWMNEFGYCRVAQKTLEMYTGLSDKTVGKMIRGLVKKGFIRKKHTNSTDMYMMRDLSKNPYVLLSEGIHHWIRARLYDWIPSDVKVRKLENLFSYDMPTSLDLMRKTVKQFINTPRHYKPFISKLMMDGNYKELYETTMLELERFLTQNYNTKAVQASDSP